MAAGDVLGAAVSAHVVQGRKKFGAQFVGEFDLKDVIAIFEQAVLGTRAKFLFDQNAVRQECMVSEARGSDAVRVGLTSMGIIAPVSSCTI